MAIALTERPIFIVGQERSGTTLLMVMLGCHPRIAVPEAAWWYPRFRGYLHTYGKLADTANLRTLATEMIFGVTVPFLGMPVNPKTIVDEILDELHEHSFAGIYCAMLERHARWMGKPRWGEKTPTNVFFARQILEDFPNAQFLCVTRDGRDMASDALNSSFGPTNILAAAHEWQFGQQTIQALRRELPPSAWLDVYYETLARAPAATLEQVCNFLGEDYDPAMLGFHQTGIAQARGKQRDHGPLAQPVTDRYVGIYREFLSLREQRIFAAIAGQEMATEGYVAGVDPLYLDQQEMAYLEELDGRVRAAMLDGPIGRLTWESYNDWLADQREMRRKRGLWTEADIPHNGVTGHRHEDLITGVRAPAQWKRHFSIKRRYA